VFRLTGIAPVLSPRQRRAKRSLNAGKINPITMEKENWNRSEYQGKSRKQVEGSIYNFVVSLAGLLATLFFVLIDKWTS
jgi:hypothetical protein